MNLAHRKKNSDLTSFASVLGDSFSSKIDLLSQILQDAHYPSLGKYKENLLAKVIEEYIPKNYQVGTGFVLFVHNATDEKASRPGFDRLNMGSHTVSKQCDILIYDASKIPVVFKDDDFVILRPESVKAVIEVKGSAGKQEVDKILDGFYDFGKKWHECQCFYSEHHQTLVRSPALYAMCWDISRDTKGRPRTNGTRIRKQIANYYCDNMDLNKLMGFPILEKLCVYNECEISRCGWYDDEDYKNGQTGWATDSGQFIRYDEEGNPYRKGDSTISSLLAGLHYAVGREFNRFYSYVSETKEYTAVPYEHHGFSGWLSETKYIRAANTDYVVDKKANK